MSKGTAKPVLWRAALDGVMDAYRLNTSQQRFGNVPEYVITTMVAYRLSKVTRGCAVEVEAPIRQVMRAAGARAKGPVPKWLRANGRFDIALWWKSKNAPRAIIEVKHPVVTGNRGGVIKDAERIVSALKRAPERSSLDWGCVTFFCHSNPSKSAEGRTSAQKQIDIVMSRLQKEAEGLDKSGLFSIRLRKGKRLVSDGNAAKTDKRYGRACCITIQRLASGS